jgi:hypothetical protein
MVLSIYDIPEILKRFNINNERFINLGANIGKYTIIISKKLKDYKVDFI